MSHPSTWPHRLLVAIPCAELAYSMYWQRLMTLEHIGWHIDNGMLLSISNAYVQEAHNKVIADALEIPDWDRLLWMEHDHVFPQDVLERHARYEEPVVGGMYFSRSIEQPTPVVYDWSEDRTQVKAYQPWQVAELLENPGLHKVDIVPMGCTSIRRDVLEQWPQDIPHYAVATAKHVGAGVMGDDVWFCRHAQDQGHDIYVDSSLQVAHVGLVPINLSVYSAWVMKMKREGKTDQKPKLEVVG